MIQPRITTIHTLTSSQVHENIEDSKEKENPEVGIVSSGSLAQLPTFLLGVKIDQYHI